MTWNELKEKAKEMGYSYGFGNYEYLQKDIDSESWIILQKNGDVFVYYRGNRCEFSFTLAQDRTPEQMLMIMRGLE